jgi:hypothetical protein
MISRVRSKVGTALAWVAILAVAGISYAARQRSDRRRLTGARPD